MSGGETPEEIPVWAWFLIIPTGICAAIAVLWCMMYLMIAGIIFLTEYVEIPSPMGTAACHWAKVESTRDYWCNNR
jgi:hypothetical protein